LAGMIARIGFRHHTEVSYDEYRRTLHQPDERKSRKFDVHFLGMFDCVPGNKMYMLRNSLRALNNPKLEPNIRNVAHAVSRDERRYNFEPLIFLRNQQGTFEQVWMPGYHSDVGGDQNE